MRRRLLRLLDYLGALAGRALLAATAGLVQPAHRTPPPRRPRVRPTGHVNCRCTLVYLPVAESGHPLGHPVLAVDAATDDAAWAAIAERAR